MADWAGGYSSEWHVCVVNRRTWSDTSRLAGVIDASISRKVSSDVPLIDTGSLTIDGNGFEGETWLRFYLTARTGGASERYPVATLLFERSEKRTVHGSPMTSLDGQSVLKPVNDTVVPRLSYIPKGVNAAAYVGDLVRRRTPAPVIVEGSFTLNDNYAFSGGVSYLKVAWDVLAAGGFCMQTDGYGRIHIRPRPTKPALVLDRANAGLLVPDVGEAFSLAGVKNRWYATLAGVTAVAENTDADSPTSYARRGRWVDEFDTSPTLVNGETLGMYATRKLAENAIVTRSFSYTREYWPDVRPLDIVRASLAQNGLEGDLRVVSQDYSFRCGLTVNEVAEMEVAA